MRRAGRTLSRVNTGEAVVLAGTVLSLVVALLYARFSWLRPSRRKRALSVGSGVSITGDPVESFSGTRSGALHLGVELGDVTRAHAPFEVEIELVHPEVDEESAPATPSDTVPAPESEEEDAEDADGPDLSIADGPTGVGVEWSPWLGKGKVVHDETFSRVSQVQAPGRHEYGWAQEVHVREKGSGKEPVVPMLLRYILALVIAGFCLWALFIQKSAAEGTREFAAATLGSLVTAALRGKG